MIALAKRNHSLFIKICTLILHRQLLPGYRMNWYNLWVANYYTKIDWLLYNKLFNLHDFPIIIFLFYKYSNLWILRQSEYSMFHWKYRKYFYVATKCTK